MTTRRQKNNKKKGKNKMQTINIKTYTFDELSEEIQQKLIKQRVEINENDYCEYQLAEDMREQAEYLISQKFKNGAGDWLKNIYYNLSYCQGDRVELELEGEYYGKPFKATPSCRYGLYLDYDGTAKQYDQLREKIRDIEEELQRYGYDLLEWYWSDEAENEAAEQLQEGSLYLSNGQPFDSLPID